MEKTSKESKKSAHGGIKISHDRQLPHLNRIEGQVRGLGKMIDAERNCLDIVHQISAIINALRRVQNDMLRDHLAMLGENIIVGDIKPQQRRKMADELVALLKQLS